MQKRRVMKGVAYWLIGALKDAMHGCSILLSAAINIVFPLLAFFIFSFLKCKTICEIETWGIRLVSNNDVPR